MEMNGSGIQAEGGRVREKDRVKAQARTEEPGRMFGWLVS
jgi:hypothetical protein